MVESRFYNVRGVKWEARFFRKGETFPDTGLVVPKQGIWATPAGRGWEPARYVAASWGAVNLEPDVFYLPEPR